MYVTLMESDEVDPNGRTDYAVEGGTRPGRTRKKPKDLSVCESEERRCGEGVRFTYRVIPHCLVYYETIKRKLKRRLIYECRCDVETRLIDERFASVMGECDG